MKVSGLVLILSGLIFVLYTFLSDFGDATATVNWAVWIGLLVFITGGVAFYQARDEE